jgi:hypothetical protein
MSTEMADDPAVSIIIGRRTSVQNVLIFIVIIITSVPVALIMINPRSERRYSKKVFVISTGLPKAMKTFFVPARCCSVYSHAAGAV